MLAIILWAIIFSVTSTCMTVLLGDRRILSGNLLEFNKFISIIFHWRFMAAMAMGVMGRYSFMLINNNLLKYPNMAQNSTTIAALISSVAFIFMLAGNYIFLGERLDLRQGMGALFIMVGILLVAK
jgi:drug/metabolite transporter (DMT)-like permease